MGRMFVEFAILGPISVWVDGHEVGLGTDARRTLLALLILQANRPVKTEQLLELLGEGPRPPSALHSHIAQLRKLLGADRLRTVPGGYQLNIPEGELDASVFEEEVGLAGAAMARGDAAGAVTELQRALARWRGPALADLGAAEWAVAEVRRLDELMVRAQEMLLDAKLATGQPDAAVGLAQMALERHPLQESLWAHLLLALYRSGRSADAVRAYQQVRARLETECSRMPSPELTKLERAILLQDPDLGDASRWTKIVTPGASSTVVTAAERVLPGGVVTFLMTDVVGSTRLWETAPAAMREALARHDELMKIAVESHEGVLLRERGEGDSTFSVFRRATDGATAALAAQLSLTHEPWPPGCVISVRMAMHTGEASERDGDYYGRAVNRVARLRAIAEGGQILVGQSAAEILLDHLPAATGLVSLGVRELRDFDRPETVYLLGGPFGAAGAAGAVGAVGAVGSLGPLRDGPTTIEMPVTAPGPAVVARPTEGAPAATRWEAVVGADREYHDRSADSDVQFPDDVQPRIIPLTEPTVLIGRRTPSRGIDPGIDLSEPREDPGVSRRHAVLERQPDGSYCLTDPGSTNGTFLNEFEKPIPPEVPIALRSGDRIYLGAWTRIEIRSE